MNGQEPAFPNTHVEMMESARQSGREPREIYVPGLTKREWFAGMAMMGAIGLQGNLGWDNEKLLAKYAFNVADAMLKEGGR